MKWKNDIHNRRARIGTSIFVLLLILLITFVGLTYIEPPPEAGIAINFGYEEIGSGETTSSQQSEPEPQPEVEETPQINEEVVTQETVDAPVVKEEKKEKVEKEPVKKEPEKKEPTPSKALSDRLSKVKSEKGQGEGVSEGGGDQGDPLGDRNSKSRSGSGTGNSGNYRLGGRSALERPIPLYKCDEEGRVIVRVRVDRNGNTLSTEAGVNIPGGPSSTTAKRCLLEEANAAARKTRWEPDPKADELQMGYIIYNFSKN